MKRLKLLSTILLVSILSFTSCQDEIDSENGSRENTNNAASPTANNLERTSMYDGSFDDFLDGVSCSSILFPVTATVNGIEVTLLSESDYSLVIDILDLLNNDIDIITLQFPFSVKLNNYTEVQIINQSELDALNAACEQAELNGENAINCLKIDFPITILTFDLNIEQTGRVIIESKQQLYAYLNNFDENALFSINYPIMASINGETVVEITSDIDLQVRITECLGTEEVIEEAENNANELVDIIVDGVFKVESFVVAGLDTATNYTDFTIDFVNDSTCIAEHTVNTLIQDVEGTYSVTSDVDTYLTLTFSGNLTFELLNNKWKVTNYSQSSIALQSSTNAAITLVLTQI